MSIVSQTPVLLVDHAMFNMSDVVISTIVLSVLGAAWKVNILGGRSTKSTALWKITSMTS